MPLAPDYKTVNVQVESGQPDSLLNWYKQLMQLRSSVPALKFGGMVMLDTENPHVLSYLRTAPEGAAPVVVSINMSKDPQTVSFDLTPNEVKGKSVKTLGSTSASLQAADSLTKVSLPPLTAWVAQVQP